MCNLQVVLFYPPNLVRDVGVEIRRRREYRDGRPVLLRSCTHFYDSVGWAMGVLGDMLPSLPHTSLLRYYR